MKVSQIIESSDVCPVCGQTPCNCTHIAEGSLNEAEQQKGADYRDPPEANYGDDYQDMVSRVKKLAGLGPLKTQYDPKKRVYRNMPTAVQPKK